MIGICDAGFVEDESFSAHLAHVNNLAEAKALDDEVLTRAMLERWVSETTPVLVVNHEGKLLGLAAEEMSPAGQIPHIVVRASEVRDV